MITNSNQMKQITVRGVETVTSIHSVAPSGGNAVVYLRMQTVINVPRCHPAIDYLKHPAPVVAIRPLKRGRIVGLRKAGWTYRRIVAHVGHNVSVVFFCFQQ